MHHLRQDHMVIIRVLQMLNTKGTHLLQSCSNTYPKDDRIILQFNSSNQIPDDRGETCLWFVLKKTNICKAKKGDISTRVFLVYMLHPLLVCVSSVETKLSNFLFTENIQPYYT